MKIDVINNKFSFSYDYTPEVVEYCKTFKNSYDNNFEYSTTYKAWMFEDLSVLVLLTNKFGRIEMTPEAYDLITKKEQEEKRLEKLSKVKTASDSDIAIPGLKGTLYPFQKVGIDFLVNTNYRALLADDPGLGKTVQAIGAILHSRAGRSLIICPATMKYVWESEVAKWSDLTSIVINSDTTLSEIDLTTKVWIVNYDLLKRFITPLHSLSFDMLVLDESHYCFPYETMIETEFGPVKIGDIVENKISFTKVLSYNETSGIMEYKSIVNHFISKNDIGLIIIKHEKGNITCTPNHKIWTEKGYKEAQKITNEDTLLLVSEDFLCTSRKILQQELLSTLEKYTGVGKRKFSEICKNSWIIKYWKKKARRNEEDEENESRPGIQQKEMERILQMEQGESDIFTSGRKRSVNKATEENIGTNRTSYGVYNKNSSGKRDFPKPSESLQGGFSKSNKKDCDRNRWKLSLNKEMEIPGSSQNRSIKLSRVVSVEILEQRGGSEPRRSSSKNNYVYNFEVEGNHNYFANNVLVSNCKTPQTIRSRAVRILSRNIPRIIMLSGTPVLNRPVEIFNPLNMLDHKVWNNYYNFTDRYCGAKYTRFGRDVSGASNVEELKTKLDKYILRRRKEDVLKDLPEKVRVTVPVEMSGAGAKIYYKAYHDFANFLRQHKGKSEPEIARSLQAEKLVKLNALRELGAAGKKDSAIELINNIIEGGEKVIVFSSFIEPLRQLFDHYSDKAVILTGSTENEERFEIVKKFQEDPNIKIFLGGIKSAGVGITLTAASNVIFLDYSWTPADHKQAEDRAHRIGSTHDSITIYTLHSRGTMDDIMLKMLNKKRGIVESLVGPGDDQSGVQMVLDEIINQIDN